MRAWQVGEHGEPVDVLVHADRPPPRPGPGELVVEVSTCGLNFSDVLLCRGAYQEHPPLPFTPGTEIVGVVRSVGAGGPADLIGTRVLARPSLPDGGLADEALVGPGRAHALPETIDDVTAAALHVTYQTAWFGLHRRARLQAGEVVLVHAGAGGTGSAAIQLAVAAGARVVATAGGPDKVRICEELGAELALDHRRDDVRAAVLDHTDGRGADVVFDTVGGSSFDIARRCVAFEGRIVVVGFASGTIAHLPTNHAMVKNYGVLGLHWPGYERHRPDLVAEAHAELLRLHGDGAVRPLVPDVRDFEQVPAALSDLARGATTGKVVVRR
jgi:NADPH2:quinone reductase